MAVGLCVIFCTIFSATWMIGFSEKILGHETDEFDFDGLPGAQHEFKIEVGAGMEECFYQKIAAGGKIHVSYEVVYGGDRSLSVYLNHPAYNGHIDASYYKPDGVIMHQAVNGGVYAICLDNSFSRMASKLVYVYLVTYVDHEWAQYQKEIEDVHLTVNNFTHSIQKVQESIKDAMLHQAQSRMHVIKDWYLVTGNNIYIQRWSIVQCIVVVCSAGMQVYFVRRLFRYTTVTPTSKPRA